MPKFCILLLLLLTLVGWSEPKKQFSFELGDVEQPKGTVHQTRPEENGRVHLFIRSSSPPQVFMLAVVNQGTSIGEDSPAAVKAFVEDYCRKLAFSLTLELSSVHVIPLERGCRFYFDILGGHRNYGEVILGRTHTLVFTGLGVSKSEMRGFRESFETRPGQFEKPLSRTESANRAAAGYCWIAGGVNLLAAPVCALVAAFFGYRFWQSVRDAMLMLCALEFVGGVVYSYYRWKNLELSASIAIAVFAGLLVTGIVPAAAAPGLDRFMGSLAASKARGKKK